MDMYQAQCQVRQNADEMRYFYNGVKEWEDNMKEMDEQLLNLKFETEELPEEQSEDKDAGSEDTEDEDTIIRNKADKHKEKGNEFVKFGRWEEAIEQYDQAIKLNGHMAVYYGNRAYCYLQLNDLVRAEQDCTLSLKLDSKYYKVLLRRAQIRRKLGNLTEAATDLDHLLQMNPENGTAWKEYKELYPELKDLDCYHKLKTKLPQHKADEPRISAKPVESIDKKKQATVKTTKTNFETSKEQADDLKTQWEKGILQKKLKKENLFASGSFFTEIIPLRRKPAHKRSKVPLKRIPIEDCIKSY